MKWAALQVALLVLALMASNSACAMTCSMQPCHDHSSAPPCHQKHGVTTCDHVLPVADVAAAVVPAPGFTVVAVVIAPVTVRASQVDARTDRFAAFPPGLFSIPILRI